jgi:hypothetical protein
LAKVRGIRKNSLLPFPEQCTSFISSIMSHSTCNRNAKVLYEIHLMGHLCTWLSCLNNMWHNS